MNTEHLRDAGPVYGLVSILACACILISCATQRPPSGGPPDTDPPSVVATNPAYGSTRVTGRTIELTFNEYVDRQSVQQATHLTPFMAGTLRFDWSGKSLVLTMPNDPLPDRTYVLTLGTTIRDVTGGNTMPSPFVLAFSTGDSIDRAEIPGILYDENPGGATILAYRLEGFRGDTLDPGIHYPDYAVQTSRDGSFALRNLAPGRYRTFALRDRQNNYLYEAQVDDIGIPSGDLTALQDTTKRNPIVRFYLAREDTAAPYVQRVDVLSTRIIEVQCSEEPADPLESHQMSLMDSSTRQTIPVILSVPVPKKKHTFLLHLGADLTPDRSYTLTVDTLVDHAGNSSLFSSIRFEGRDAPDTLRPFFASFHGPDLLAWPRDSILHVLFSHPMLRTDAVTLLDSAGMALPLTSVWHTSHYLLITPPQLPEAVPHSLCFNLRALKDSLRGIAMGDTLECFRFLPEKESEFGSLSGTVRDDVDSVSVRYVRTRGVDGRKVQRSTTVLPNGRFELKNLPPGRYVLDAFSDRDGNGRYSHGKAHPFAPSERFGVSPDTLRIRSRWETGGVTIRIP